MKKKYFALFSILKLNWMEWWYNRVEYMKKAVYVPSTQLNAEYEILL